MLLYFLTVTDPVAFLYSLIIFFCCFILCYNNKLNQTVSACSRSSDGGSDGSRGAAAAAAALRSGQRGAGHPGGHGLEHHGRRVLQRPELRHQPPTEAGAERRERGWVQHFMLDRFL